MDSNVKNSWSNRDAKFLAFTSVEVRFVVDSSSCSNNKSLTSAIVTMIPYFFDYRPRPRIVAAATRGRRTHNSDDGHRARSRAVRVVQLFSMADS